MIDARTKRLHAKQAEVVQALAHPIRVAIADLLRKGERCVQDIAGHVGAQRPNVSRRAAVIDETGYQTLPAAQRPPAGTTAWVVRLPPLRGADISQRY